MPDPSLRCQHQAAGPATHGIHSVHKGFPPRAPPSPTTTTPRPLRATENFFRYMRQHHGLDTLVSNAWRDDSQQTIANPERKRLTREIAAQRAAALRLRTELGTSVLEDRAALARRQAVQRQLADLGTEIASLALRRRIAPPFVTVAQAGGVREVMELERKHLVDHVKVAAYNAEEWLLERLERHYRNPNDIRDLLRAFAELPGSIHTTHTGVAVTLDPPDTPAHRVALRGLCDDLNATGTRFPGTELPVHYAVSVHHSEQAA